MGGPFPIYQSYGIYAFLFHCCFRSAILLPELLGLSPSNSFLGVHHPIPRHCNQRDISKVQHCAKSSWEKKTPKVVQTWSPIITPVQNLCAFSFMQFAFGAFVNGFQPGPLPFLVSGDFALKPFWANKIRGQLWTQGQHGHC